MKYIKLALTYSVRNILHLAVLAIIPAVIMGALTDPSSSMNLFANLNNIESFGDIFKRVSELNWKSVLIALALIPVLLIFFSGMCGVVSRHMRRGVMQLHNFPRLVNNNIMYVFLLLITFIFVLEIYAVLLSSFAILWLEAFGVGRTTIALISITMIILMLILIGLITICIIWLPTMTITGLNPKKALAESFRAIKGKYLKLFLAVIVPIIPYYLISAPLTFFEVPARQLIYIVLYLFMIIYYTSLMYSAYCDIDDIDREDIKKSYYDKDSDDIDNSIEGGQGK